MINLSQYADMKWQKQLATSPDSENLVTPHLSANLTNPQHPLGRYLAEFVAQFKKEGTQDIHTVKLELQQFLGTLTIDVSLTGQID